MLNSNFTLLILPIYKESHPDNRFNSSLERIRSELGEETINELIDFHSHANQLQKGYARQGLALTVTVFKEAIYLHHHHRFDDDDPMDTSQGCSNNKHNRLLNVLASPRITLTSLLRQLIG